jgi:leucine dehydrogenase
LGVFDAGSLDGHEEIVYGSDPESGLQTIIAIHSTALGPALGGTRFYAYEHEDDALDDVLRLSRAMSLKASSAGLDLGGGKAVIIGDPRTMKSERLWRAYGRIVDSLGGRYITAEDVGTSHYDMEMIRRETRWVVGVPKAEGGSGDPSPATARGLMRALQAVSTFLWDTRDLAGRRVSVQGVGKVGSDFVRRLTRVGAEVVVSDIHVPATDYVVQEYGAKAVPNDEIFDVDCDVFAPCALGGSLRPDTIPRLQCRAVVGSANNQLSGDGAVDLLAERGILYAPDFVVNAGGLINVYEERRGYEVERAAHAIDKVYDNTLRVLEAADRNGVSTQTAAAEVAEDRIRAIGNLRLFRRSGDDRN